jgi:hypothetical protein
MSIFSRPYSAGLDEHPEKMRQRRETVEHPFGTINARMGATHFLMKTLPRVAAEMALHVLAYEHHGHQTANSGDQGVVAATELPLGRLTASVFTRPRPNADIQRRVPRKPIVSA